MWTFEPSAALKVYEEMMGPEKIDRGLQPAIKPGKRVKKQGKKLLKLKWKAVKNTGGKCSSMPPMKAI
jgi:hypothetical protein